MIFRRLSVQLNLIIVLVILFEWGFLFALPNALFQLGSAPSVETVSLKTPEQQFAEVTRRILDDDSLSDAQKQARLEPLLAQRLGAGPIPLSEVSRLLTTVYEPRAVFTPLFWLILLLLPTVTLSFLLRWWLVQPLERVAQAASRVMKGDLSARVAPPNALAHRGDELFALTERFNRMAQTLQSHELERQRLTADIAHELRTPLAVMQAQLDAMLEEVIPTGRDELLSLSEETELLTRLVEDLRLLSLAEAGRLTLIEQEVDVALLLTRVRQSFSAAAAAKGVSLTLNVPEKEVNASLDPERLRQALGNLLHNALRHTPPGGCVRLEGTRHADTLHLSVADTGSGIPEADLPYIFNRFYRADKSRVRSEGGSGLGLAIVQTLVELHGGHIEVKNQPEGGAVFSIQLSVTSSPHS